MKWFNLAFVGWLVLIAALAFGAHLLDVPTKWIIVGALALVGIGLIVSSNRSARAGE